MTKVVTFSASGMIHSGLKAGHRRWIAIGAVIIISGVFPLIFANRSKKDKLNT
jgi:low temperature requirement protein LtrA